MFIEPSTKVILLKDCPLDQSYENTIYFETVTDQTNYFKSLKHREYSQYTYQRATRGVIKVQSPVADLYSCNYMMFQNELFSKKWFYAFITNVEYISNDVTRVEYAIDYMQTYFFDYELKECFVEREHSATDNIGDNTIPENLETGTYITTNQNNYSVCQRPLLVVLSAEQVNDENNQPIFAEPQTVLGYPLTCYWVGCGSLTAPTSLQQQIDVLKRVLDVVGKAGKIDAIIGTFVYDVSLGAGTSTQVIGYTGASRTLPIAPKNNKLYTYPYCCNVLVADGQSVELRYELFNNHTPTFAIRSTFGANYKALCNPTNYEGMQTDLLHSVSIGNMPVLPFIRDYFQNWWAQNGASTIYGTIPAVGKILSGGVDLMRAGSNWKVGAGVTSHTVAQQYLGKADQQTESGWGKIGEGVYEIGATLVKVYEQSIIPDSLVGTVNASDVTYFSGLKGFYNYCRTIRPEYIKIIDEYFDRFGYATHVNKIPNRNVRPHWTYTKTRGCNIVGGAPASALSVISSIYNKGITFWRNGNEIGNYELDNSV